MEKRGQVDSVCLCGFLETFIESNRTTVTGWEMVTGEDRGCFCVGMPGFIDGHVRSEQGWFLLPPNSSQ